MTIEHYGTCPLCAKVFKHDGEQEVRNDHRMHEGSNCKHGVSTFPIDVRPFFFFLMLLSERWNEPKTRKRTQDGKQDIADVPSSISGIFEGNTFLEFAT